MSFDKYFKKRQSERLKGEWPEGYQSHLGHPPSGSIPNPRGHSVKRRRMLDEDLDNE